MADSLDTELQMMWKRIYAQCQTIAQQEVLRLFGPNLRGGALNPTAIQPSGTIGQVLTTTATGTSWAPASASGTTLSTALVSTPPLESDLVTALGTPSAVGRQITQINNDATGEQEYLTLSDGSAFWSALLTKARLGAATASATNAASYQTTPTYDGSGQVVEPCVLYVPGGWNGYTYWLGVTPFPASNTAYENPSILVSNDGNTWSVPSGVTNPLVPNPGGGYNNDDPWLLLDSSGTLWYYYEQQSSSQVNVYVMSSTDGVHWSSSTLLFTITGGSDGALSPCVVYDGTQYVMWSVDFNSGSSYVLEQRTCTTPNGTWSSPTTCTVTGLPAGYGVFHLDVYKRGARYQMFGLLRQTGSPYTTQLYFLESSDGLTWACAAAALISTSVSGWDDVAIYRASAVPTATGYDLWYSAEGSSSVWHMGRTTVGLTDLILAQVSRLAQMRDTTANVESFGGMLEEGAIAFATDTGRLGVYTGGNWQWAPAVADLPGLATTSIAGLVRPDGSTITVSGGVLTAHGTTPYSPLVDPATPDLIWDPIGDVIVGPDD